MSTNPGRRALATAAIALFVSLSSGCGSGDGEQSPATTTATGSPTTAAPNQPPSTQPVERTVTLEVRNAAVVGGPVRVETRLGEQLRIVVSSDVTDEVHVHGYDRRAKVDAGGQAAFVLVADIPGVFEMELEKRRLRLGELVVKG